MTSLHRTVGDTVRSIAFIIPHVRHRTDFVLKRGETLSFAAVFRMFHILSLQNRKGCHMNINLSIGPLVSLIAGILILVAPRLLNYIVALYLIIIGLLGLFGGGFHLK